MLRSPGGSFSGNIARKKEPKNGQNPRAALQDPPPGEVPGAQKWPFLAILGPPGAAPGSQVEPIRSCSVAANEHLFAYSLETVLLMRLYDTIPYRLPAYYNSLVHYSDLIEGEGIRSI